MKLLIAGGAGFVGANLVHRCLAEPGIDLAVLDSLNPLFLSTTAALDDIWDRIRFVQGDLRDDRLLAELVQDQDVIINCAGQTSHPLSMENPVLDAEINCLGNIKLLEAVRQYNPHATIVYTSTSTVVGRPDHGSVDEDHHECPLDIYSANNCAAEKYYHIYHTAHDLKTVCLRFTNLYGPFGKGDPAFGFINFFIARAAADQPIPIFGDGAQKRNVMYVEDAAEVLLLAARQPRLAGTVHFATGDEHLSVREIAETIVSVFGRGRLEQVGWPDSRRRIEIGDVSISSARLRTITGWRPRFDFESGLRKTRDTLKLSPPEETR